MSPNLYHKRLRDFESFDEIRLKVVPRFKTSGLSGDTWRQHVQVDFMFKGEIVAETGYMDMRTALLMMGHEWIKQQEPIPERVIELERAKCDQPVCTNDAVGKYRIKEEFSSSGDKLVQDTQFRHYRQFCKVHAKRGDASMEDSDSNYEPLDSLTPDQSTNTQESPSVLADVVVAVSGAGCNLHPDCAAANAAAKAKGKHMANHCTDECCEDCFGT